MFQKHCASRWSQWKVWGAYEAGWGSQLKRSLQPNIFLSCISLSPASFQPSSSSVSFNLSQYFFLIAKHEKLHRNLIRLHLQNLDWWGVFYGIMLLSCFSPKFTGTFKMKPKPTRNSLDLMLYTIFWIPSSFSKGYKYTWGPRFQEHLQLYKALSRKK